MLKAQSWVKRANAILAEEFDVVAATALVRDIRNSAGLSNNLRVAADQAIGSLQAADTGPENKWQLAVAKQKFELLRAALARAAFRGEFLDRCR